MQRLLCAPVAACSVLLCASSTLFAGEGPPGFSPSLQPEKRRPELAPRLRVIASSGEPEAVRLPRLIPLRDAAVAEQQLSSDEGARLAPLLRLARSELASRQARIDDSLARGDGGGGDFTDLTTAQYLYSDFVVGNVVLLLWNETNWNREGIRFSYDGKEIGVLRGLCPDDLPGPNGTFLLQVPGLALDPFDPAFDPTRKHTMGIITEDGSAAEIDQYVFDYQPNFGNVQGLSCVQDTSAEDCQVVCSWRNSGPAASEYRVVRVGGPVVVSPMELGNDIRRASPIDAIGQACFQAASVAHGNDPGLSSVFPQPVPGSFFGFTLESCASVTCGRPTAPAELLLRQVRYPSTDGQAAFFATWKNPESAYAEGVTIYLEERKLGTLASDIPGVEIGALAAGPQKFGVEGVESPEPESRSAITSRTIDLKESPQHSNPIDGDVTCNWVPVEGGKTIIDWPPADSSTWIDVFVEEGESLTYIGTGQASSDEFQLLGTTPDMRVALRFVKEIDCSFYGSELLYCVPDPTRRFLRGNCNGDGRVDISDAVSGLGFLFLGEPEPGCKASCNTNGDDRAYDISDMIYLLNFLFSGGPAPAGWIDTDSDGAVDSVCESTDPYACGVSQTGICP